MRRILALVLTVLLSVGALAGCAGGGDDVALETVGEGVSTEGRPVFYEFFSTG